MQNLYEKYRSSIIRSQVYIMSARAHLQYEQIKYGTIANFFFSIMSCPHRRSKTAPGPSWFFSPRCPSLFKTDIFLFHGRGAAWFRSTVVHVSPLNLLATKNFDLNSECPTYSTKAFFDSSRSRFTHAHGASGFFWIPKASHRPPSPPLSTSVSLKPGDLQNHTYHVYDHVFSPSLSSKRKSD